MTPPRREFTYRDWMGMVASLGFSEPLPDGSELLVSVIPKQDYGGATAPANVAYSELIADGWRMMLTSQYRIAPDAYVIIFWRPGGGDTGSVGAPLDPPDLELRASAALREPDAAPERSEMRQPERP
jgi:hypothetical protein